MNNAIPSEHPAQKVPGLKLHRRAVVRAEIAGAAQRMLIGRGSGLAKRGGI